MLYLEFSEAISCLSDFFIAEKLASVFWRNILQSKRGFLAACASSGVTRATGMAFEINTSVSHSRKVDGGAQSRRVGLRASPLSLNSLILR